MLRRAGWFGGVALVMSVVLMSGLPSVLASGSAFPDPVFVGITPTRVLDSRVGTGGYSTPWGAGADRQLVVAGVGGVPAGATAVVMNVTATNVAGHSPGGGSYITVYPAGVARPLASNLNFSNGMTVPNLATVDLGEGGAVRFYNDQGSVDIIADVVGFYIDHDHDDRYYTEAEVDQLLAAVAATAPPCTEWPHVGVDWTGCDLTGANLTGQNLSYGALSGINLTNAQLQNANFGYADLTNANLSGATGSATELAGADLTGANVSGVGGTWHFFNTICPDGVNSEDKPLDKCW